MRRCLILLLFSTVASAADHPLVLVSFDGFRWDYPERLDTPHIDTIAARGFRVDKMKPAFIPLTFPNHYTLVTGLIPTRHGLVANNIYDHATGATYTPRTREEVRHPRWYTGKALWEWADDAGLVTASYFWVGSETTGRAPDFFFAYDPETTVAQRLEQFTRWMDPATEPTPDLILLYFEMLDDAGHRHGPDAREVEAVIAGADRVIGRILAIAKQSGREPNMLFVADHGMAGLNGEGLRHDEIEAALAEQPVAKIMKHYAYVDIFLEDASPAAVAKAMAALPHPPFVTWYTREEHPFDPHATRNGHIFGWVTPPHAFLSDRGAPKGGHGFHPDRPDMAAVCFGLGPAFKPDSRLQAVNAVDVFPLSMHLLGLDPVASDGQLPVWQPVLVRSISD